MNRRRWIVGLVASPLLLAGCASARSVTGAHQPQGAPTTTPGQAMAGMSMSAGPVKPTPTSAAAPRPRSTSSAGPSATAQMVCGADIRRKVALALGLSAPAPVRSSYANRLYTCTYRLPAGPLILSVQESRTKAEAGSYFTTLRRRLAPTTPLAGLGERAATTSTGVVIVVKDNLTLRVDTTGLPTVFGTQHQKRTDLAYEMASAVLGCWTGDE
ncbi:MAG: hypothetical protein QOH17_3431 [Pseudonocardiales bacterium]|nr:hypothetical protein [Pseudonocardiales bacterium]